MGATLVRRIGNMQQHATIVETSFTRDADLRPVRRPRGRPIHRMLVSFSAAYFAGALVTDLVYWRMPDVMWERFSIWRAAGESTGRPGPARLATRSRSRSRSPTPSFTAATAIPPWYRPA